MTTYRVHVHDQNDQGRWLASADFSKRPLSDEIEAKVPVLSKAGRYEVRVNVLQGDEEHYLYAWLQDGKTGA
jgi:polyphosphate kinase